jgi:hypothetical protein
VLCFLSYPSVPLYLCFSGIRFSLFAFMAALAKVAQRRIAPLFSPHLRQLGGASRASRRHLRHKIRQSVALPRVSARYNGDNFAILRRN